MGDAGGTVQVTWRSVLTPRPLVSATATVCGSVSVTLLPSDGPEPAGVKTSVWASLRFQRPGTPSLGSDAPSARLTGWENVSRSWSPGSSRPPGVGLTSATGRLAGGKKWTVVGGPSFSHERAATETRTEPARAFCGSLSDVPVPRALWPA